LTDIELAPRGVAQNSRTQLMARIPRVVLPGAAHHITQRGIRRFDIFRDRDDRKLYVKLFAESSSLHGLRICSYCLMTNHIHFIAIPEEPDSIWKTFHRCHSRYAVKFNLKYGVTGHLFQGRPFSCVLDNRHFWTAIRYVERNPVRAGIVAKAEEYEWSSARAHCNKVPDPLLDPEWLHNDEVYDWRAWLDGPDEGDYLQEIRSRTLTGRPCGDDSFIRIVESGTGRHLRIKKRGPKR